MLCVCIRLCACVFVCVKRQRDWCCLCAYVCVCVCLCVFCDIEKHMSVELVLTSLHVSVNVHLSVVNSDPMWITSCSLHLAKR